MVFYDDAVSPTCIKSNKRVAIILTFVFLVMLLRKYYWFVPHKTLQVFFTVDIKKKFYKQKMHSFSYQLPSTQALIKYEQLLSIKATILHKVYRL